MLSPDGHTRTFAADASGTVFSDGAAVVRLKRLSDAQADGNPVYAILRGGAVNNDGAAKASFTAPSAAGQAAVIAMALTDAQVDARTISYVEAHGTATPVGDPIEIEGLTEAFRRDTADCGYCAIGSVKSNIGHTVVAAGAAGVIKTALALSRAQTSADAACRKAECRDRFFALAFRGQRQVARMARRWFAASRRRQLLRRRRHQCARRSRGSAGTASLPIRPKVRSCCCCPRARARRSIACASASSRIWRQDTMRTLPMSPGRSPSDARLLPSGPAWSHPMRRTRSRSWKARRCAHSPRSLAKSLFFSRDRARNMRGWAARCTPRSRHSAKPWMPARNCWPASWVSTSASGCFPMTPMPCAKPALHSRPRSRSNTHWRAHGWHTA